jgi:hypothetical protein
MVRRRNKDLGQRLKFRQANNPKEANHKEEREPLRTRTLHTLHQLHEAYQLKKERESKPHKNSKA